MRSTLICAPLLLVGCGGPSDETLLDELRVLAMVPEAPEIQPGEATALDVRVVDPEAQGFDALVWTCTNTGEGCLEDTTGRAPVVDASGAGQLTSTVEASATLAYVVGTEPLPLIAAWTLACRDGLCPLIEDVQAGLEVDPALWADPTDWIDELPMEGVSLALTTLSVSTRAVEERHPAPTLTGPTDPLEVETGGTLTLSVTATGELDEEARLWGYAEGGGFVGASTRLDAEGAATMDWVAPEEPGEVALYLVLVDGLGGAALWEGAATAR